MSFAGRGSISATDSAVEQLCRCVVSSDLENLTNSLLYVHLFAIQLHAYNCSNQGVRLLRVLMWATPTPNPSPPEGPPSTSILSPPRGGEGNRFSSENGWQSRRGRMPGS